VGECISGRIWVNGESKGGFIWSMCFIYFYENRTMKPVEIVLSSREGNEGK
jgi:hypothetical protein